MSIYHFILFILSSLNMDDLSRTFHVPVVTPWEIEVGLGGRDWEGIFRSDSGNCGDLLSYNFRFSYNVRNV